MTIASSQYFTDWLAADGTNKNWSYSFALRALEDIYIQVRDAAGVITETQLDLAWYPTNPNEGYVKYPNAAGALAAGNFVRIVRELAYTQEVAIGDEGSFRPEIHEDAFDRVAQQLQQVSGAADRAIKVPLGDTTDLEDLTNNLIDVAAALSAIIAVNANEANINAVSADLSNVDIVAGSITNVNSVATDIIAVNTVATDIADVSAVAAIDSAVSTVAANIVDVQNAAGNAAIAVAARNAANKWATEAEDVGVNDGVNLAGYSAFHWAMKAMNVVWGGLAATVHALASKAAPVGADEVFLADSAASWAGKKTTLNLAVVAGLPQRIAATADYAANWDTIRGAGWYYGNSASLNGPYDPTGIVSAGFVEVPRSDTAVQTVYSASTGTSSDTMCHRRVFKSGAWGAWYKLQISQAEQDARYTKVWNWIINGDFSVNQRQGTKTPGTGVYGYDRWKGHASGLEQIIEGLPAGTYTLTFGGGGTGSVGGATAKASPGVFVVGSSGNTSVVVPATATNVSLVRGDYSAGADPFVARHPGIEMMLCKRYFQKTYDTNTAPATSTATGILRYFGLGLANFHGGPISLLPMRAPPTVTFYSQNGTVARSDRGGTLVATTAAVISATNFVWNDNVTSPSSDTSNFHWTADAEL